MFVPGFWLGMETFVAPCNNTGANCVNSTTSKKFGWTFPIGVKNCEKWRLFGWGRATVHWAFVVTVNCTLRWTDSRWLCRKIRRIAFFTTMLLAWRNAAHRATAWTWAWLWWRHLTTKNGHDSRQLELQIVGHNSCVYCDCSVVETCWDA